MTGLEMLLKSLKINIDPAEVVRVYENTKQAIPALIEQLRITAETIVWMKQAHGEQLQALYRIEGKLDLIIKEQCYGGRTEGDIFRITPEGAVSRINTDSTNGS